MNHIETMIMTGEPEYNTHFWNAMRGNDSAYEKLQAGRVQNIGTFLLPTAANNKCMAALEQESLFRRIATVIYAYNNEYKLTAKDTDDVAVWVPGGSEIPIYDGMADFTDYDIGFYKAAAFVKLSEDFVNEAAFDMETCLVQRFAKNFGKAEDSAFINGTGHQMPTGILAENGGAEIGHTTSAVTFDDVNKLYFSVKSEYRKNGCWLMNDETALYLRSLKDEHGEYLWHGNADELLGKPVHINNEMPSIGKSTKPIAFGDFSYYWVVARKPISARALTEAFTVHDQIGYLAIEYLDGKLIRPEAIKVIQVAE